MSLFINILQPMNPKKLYEAISRDSKYHRSGAWDAAFVLYNLNNDRKMRSGCESCAYEVRKWLKKFSGYED